MQYRKRMLQKKGTALLLSALLLASALPLAAYAEEVSAKTTEYVNFRSGPGTNYSSQGIIASGTTITVTDTSNSEWYAVRLSNGSTGYIYAEYISMSTGGSTSNGEERSAKTTEYVNFRSGPGTNYNSKGVIALGTTVTVTDTSMPSGTPCVFLTALQAIFLPNTSASRAAIRRLLRRHLHRRHPTVPSRPQKRPNT